MKKKTRRIFEKAFYKYREHIDNGELSKAGQLKAKLGELMGEHDIVSTKFPSKEVLVNQWIVYHISPDKYRLTHSIYASYKLIHADKAVRMVSKMGRTDLLKCIIYYNLPYTAKSIRRKKLKFLRKLIALSMIEYVCSPEMREKYLRR